MHYFGKVNISDRIMPLAFAWGVFCKESPYQFSGNVINMFCGLGGVAWVVEYWRLS